MTVVLSRPFGEARPEPSILQQTVGELPWGHNMALLTKLEQHEQRLGYAHAAPEEDPTIGLLLSKGENKIVANCALRDTKTSMCVAEYQLVELLPEDLETSLPSIEQIERELGGMER